ncbi:MULTISPECIES: DMT family transporter [Aeromonas]|jgi:drug/metabolite transporter (DMT)-like permease|uniref:DMT family transporter n=1 Tax=Aeromonas salmonicida TaxID=645 RepID=A0AAX3VTB0_AERSA|nr:MULTISPECIES: DMT family transporter [Aeromonas]MBP6141078.1 EamA family transporter [Aeromonas sp.]ARW83632.1 Integral membrane protein [Aeromonas salmonicida]MBP6360880.1 EamA family transporter [Aeromonas sp.]MBP8158986.1 EamA family transporter [Aeromonas sp.]MBS2782206.1 EamA family transporter [Aeromonas salmonicida]
MTPTIFAAILLAALLHALWNALAKRQAEGRVSVLLVSLCSGLFAAPFLPLVGLPVPAEYPWLALSILLHCGYCLFLGRAYRLGEFGQIYPLARGSAPLVTLLFGALLLGEVPGVLAVAGALVLVSGVLLMAWRGGIKLASGALSAVLITALFTAAYTLSDGAGARSAGEPVRYTLWLFALTALMMPLLMRWQSRTAWRALDLAAWRTGALGGALSLLAYGIVIWAMTQAPIGLVAALRESSVLFAVLLSWCWLGEKLGRVRLCAALVILCGILLIRLA